MKDLRVYIAEVLNNSKNKREDDTLARFESIQKDYPNMSKEDHLKLNNEFWLHIRYNVEEYDHADIESHCRAIASEKEKVSGREDLYLWWYITTYFGKVIEWKVNNFIEQCGL